MSEKAGVMFPIKVAIAEYMARWYQGVLGDTKAVAEFAARGASYAIKIVADRMIDDVEAMLESYQKDQQGPHGKNSKFPVVFIALDRAYTTTGTDWGARQGPRRMVCLENPPNASVYGLRVAMHDVRVQFAILAADSPSARSLAAQLGLFVGDMANRRMVARHTFGQYTIPAPAVIENPDMMFGIAGQSKTSTVLVGDITLKVTTPFLDAPKDGEENDGSANNPPGYPMVTEVTVKQLHGTQGARVTMDGVDWEEMA